MKIVHFKKKIFSTIFSISLIFICGSEVAHSDTRTLKLITNYLGDTKTLQAKFSQTDHTGDIMRGDLFLKKPGKIRLSYDPPHDLQIVSKQQAVLVFDPKNSGIGPLTYPLSSTPLGFLINNDMNSLISDNVEISESDNFILLKVHNPQYNLSIKFNKNPLSIFGWLVKNNIGETIKVTLNNIRENNYISDEVFKTEKDYQKIRR